MALPAGLDATWLKRRYLFGVLQRWQGPPLPEDLFNNALCVAADLVARDIGIVIEPTPYTAERYDVDLTSAPYWQQKLRHRPVQAVTKWVFRWGTNESAYTVPVEWIYLRQEGFGQVEIIPSQVSPQPQIFVWPWMPYATFTYANRWPAFVEVDYEAGFASIDNIPPILLDAIGLWAAIQALVEIGQAIARGYASQSIGRDGLSQGRSFARGGSQLFADDIRTYTERFYKDMDILRGTYATAAPLIVG